jgi:hypothetical protein
MVHASAHDQLGPLLAGLVGDLEEATRSHPSERPSALWLLGQVYQIGSAMLAQVAESPGACLAGDRAVDVGERAGDRCLVAAGQFRLAHAYAAAGCDNLALRVLHDVNGIRDAVVVAGMVRLIGACTLLQRVLEARSGDPEAARAHLARAGGLAARVDVDDGDPYGTEFGPANVALHQVAVAIELGQPGEALSVAKRIDTAGLSLERRRRLAADGPSPGGLSMLGRNHTAVGVAAFAGAVWVGGHLLGFPAIDAQQAVAGTVVSAGAALAPDLDEAHSSAGRSNPISHLPIFGGHRGRTHCVLAVAAVTVTVLVCQGHRDAADRHVVQRGRTSPRTHCPARLGGSAVRSLRPSGIIRTCRRHHRLWI